MGKGKQDLKPDIVVKNYWRNNEQFADFFNAVLFDGKPMNKNVFDRGQILVLMIKNKYIKVIIQNIKN